ncbi:MAG: glycosyltransferase family 39 protein, partial [Gemmatimonadales bacterium]
MSRPARLTLAAILGAGVVLRVAQYLSNQSLFVDEAMLSLNIATRSWLGLLSPLDYGQTSPVPFLWAERAAVLLGGVNEFALRALPLLAGAALPFAVWRFTRRFLAPREALLATAFTSFSPILIQFSAMVKPYTVDALVAVILAHLTLDVVEAVESGKAWRRLIAAGVAALLVSTPAPFVLAGVGLALILAPRVRERPGWARQAGIAAAVWGGVFVLQYVLLYRSVATSPYMHEYWR